MARTEDTSGPFDNDATKYELLLNGNCRQTKISKPKTAGNAKLTVGLQVLFDVSTWTSLLAL